MKARKITPRFQWPPEGFCLLTRDEITLVGDLIYHKECNKWRQVETTCKPGYHGDSVENAIGNSNYYCILRKIA